MELYRRLDQYYFEHREEIFALNPELLPLFLRSSILNENEGYAYKIVQDQALLTDCKRLLQELKQIFSPMIGAFYNMGGIYSIPFHSFEEQMSRRELERIFNIYLLLLDEVKNPAIVECFLNTTVEEDSRLIELIEQDFTARFLDPLEEADQALAFKEKSFHYLKASLFQEIMELVKQSGDISNGDILFDSIDLSCRSKIQYVKAGYKLAPLEMTCTTEKLGQFLSYHYAGKTQMVLRHMIEYSYPDPCDLNDLLRKHGIDEKQYPDFANDNHKLKQYIEFKNFLYALAELEGQRIFNQLELEKITQHISGCGDESSQLLDFAQNHKIYHHLQQVNVLQKAQHLLIERLVNTDFICNKRKDYLGTDFAQRLANDLVDFIHPKLDLIPDDVPAEIKGKVLAKERSCRISEFWELICSSETMMAKAELVKTQAEEQQHKDLITESQSVKTEYLQAMFFQQIGIYSTEMQDDSSLENGEIVRSSVQNPAQEF